MSNAAELFQDRLSERDPSCLHCWVLAAVEAYCIAEGMQIGGDLHLDGNRVMAALAAVFSNVLSKAPKATRIELLASLNKQLNEHVDMRVLN